MDQKITRRTAVAGMFAGAAVLVLARRETFAQDATPVAPSAAVAPDMSAYPRLDVTITDSALDVSMTDVPAGYVLLNVTNKSSDEGGAGILGPGEGQTMDDLKAAVATPPADQGGFPPFLYTSTILGGPGSLQPGQSGQVVVNISAGDWAVFPEGAQPPTFITATESSDSNTTAPKADLTVTFTDFAFSGFDSVKSGPQIWEITSTGDQPHMLSMVKIPDGTTVDQLMATVITLDAGTPTPGSLSPDQVEFLSEGVLLLSKGQTMYLPLNLVGGTYGALCFVTDPATGMPHVMEGMIAVFAAK